MQIITSLAALDDGTDLDLILVPGIRLARPCTSLCNDANTCADTQESRSIDPCRAWGMVKGTMIASSHPMQLPNPHKASGNHC